MPGKRILIPLIVASPLLGLLVIASPAAATCYGTTLGGRVDNNNNYGTSTNPGISMTAVDLGGECQQGRFDYALGPRENSEMRGLTDADSYRDNKNYVAHDGQTWAANANWGNGDSIGGSTRKCLKGVKNGIAYDIICT
jgi:hypothetical protein